jgi:hypothetical protein
VSGKTAKELLPEVLQIVDSDLMKAHHYLDKAMQVAVTSGDMQAAYLIAPISTGVAMYIKQLQHGIKEMQKELEHGR